MTKNKLDIDKLLEVIRNCLPERDAIRLHEPLFQGNEWVYTKECLDTGWVSSAGKYVERFEQQLAEYTGVSRAVAVVNGTAALHICLKLVGVERNDEVMVPALTFVATANAVCYCNAIPHFVDSDEYTLGLDPYKLESYLKEIAEIRNNECFNRQTGRRIKAVVPMHTFGHPVDIDPLVDVCKHYRLELVEDAAEALGSFYKGEHVGNRSRLAVLSFNGNKIITTGGGGAILTNDQGLGELAKHLTTTAKLPHRWEFVHDQVGYNYRLPNINAALGCAQLEQLTIFLKKKRALAERYRERLADIEGVRFFIEPEFAKSNYWLNALLLTMEEAEQRDALLEIMNDNGIMTRPAWRLMHKLPMYENCPRMELSTAEGLEARLINLPSSVFL
jgi:perosamine synthetase